MLKATEDAIISYIRDAGEGMDVPEWYQKTYVKGELCKYNGLIYRASVSNQVIPTNLKFWQCIGEELEIPQVFLPDPIYIEKPVIKEVIVEHIKYVKPPLATFWNAGTFDTDQAKNFGYAEKDIIDYLISKARHEEV